MKNIYKFFALGTLILGVVACDQNNDSPAPQPGPGVEVAVELKADKPTIVADGEEYVTFTVLVDGEERTTECQIINVDDNSIIEGGTFATTTPSNYTFVAAYGKHTSNKVMIAATEPQQKPIDEAELLLSADKTTIKADGNEVVTFTVTADGEDVTSESVICYVMDGNVLEGNKFSSTAYGTFQFVATWGELTSNILDIKVTQIGGDPTPPPAVGDYAVGDLYDENGVKGVIFGFKDKNTYDDYGNIAATTTYAYIMSMDQTALEWSTENVWCNCISPYGDWNTQDMLNNGTSHDKYPAAQWCVAHGDGWFMPSSSEMQMMWNAVSGGKLVFDKESVELFNSKLDDPIEEDFYWSSNETLEDMAEVVAFMENSVICLEPQKYKKYCVRAVYKFEVANE